MNEKNASGNGTMPLSFDLKEMSEAEITNMFMGVSVKSLASWYAYYKSRKQDKVCDLISEISTLKNGRPHTL